MILRKLTDSVTVVNAPLVDGYGGQQVRDWDGVDAVRSTVRALVQFLDSTEDVDSRDSTDSRWRLILGPSAPLSATSRVEWSGSPTPLEVDGQPGVFYRGGRPDHIEAVLKVSTDA